MKESIKDCPCNSGKSYEACCKSFHLGALPVTAVELMRSRYSAYALSLPQYLIETTHPANPQYVEDRKLWAKKILEFSKNSQFKKLEVLGFQEKGNSATVTFIAQIFQGKEDITFTEKSYFEKKGGKWLYRVGRIAEGHVPSFVTTGQMRELPLAYYGDPILRRVADPVVNITDDIRKFVEEMVETMDACDGVGLAAPQVHQSVQIFVMRAPEEDENQKMCCGDVQVFINPKVSLASVETCKLQEGCLSIPTIHAEVERPKEIIVEYTNLEGQKIKRRCSGWEARIIQHENDHIQGILFIDHLSKEEQSYLEPFLKRLKNRIHDGTEL